MSDEKQVITIQIGEDGPKHELSGIPALAWDRFSAAAKLQFPKQGEDAWAAFLSEVIMAISGGDKTVTYFMTGVPAENAAAIHGLLQQIGFTWDRFHAYLLRASVLPNNLRLVNFSRRPEDGDNAQKYGTVIITGIDPVAFSKTEDAVGHSFEQVMGTVLAAAAVGTLTFSAETTFIEPIKP
jgi:hypothetical protein